MATIKSLLSTALESFLTSKKSWVSEQPMPKNQEITLTPNATSTTGYYNVTPAKNGLLIINAWKASSATTSDLYFAQGQGGTKLPSYFSIVVPVRKGDIKNFWAVNVDTSRLQVILRPSVGDA